MLSPLGGSAGHSVQGRISWERCIPFWLVRRGWSMDGWVWAWVSTWEGVKEGQSRISYQACVRTVPPHSMPEQRQKRSVLPEGWWAWSWSDFRASNLSPFLLVIPRSLFKLWITIAKGMLPQIQIRIWNIALKITAKACYPSLINKYRKGLLLCFHRHRRQWTLCVKYSNPIFCSVQVFQDRLSLTM